MIELSRPLGSAKHQARYYLGSCIDLKKRMEQHQSGNGAAMLRAANQQGITYQVCKSLRPATATEARRLERKLKAHKNHKSLLTKDWNRYL
ncbi:MAG: GIY-YIG nuclease family protein [Synechococcales cyanobacterium C42_A2020_086]|nr:GIY-YIG nuclease family protein [Synechococcales cyanobacterium C42_A2020_086]